MIYCVCIIIIVVIVRFKSFVKFNACSDVYPLSYAGAHGIYILCTRTCSCGSLKRQKNEKIKIKIPSLFYGVR